MKRDVKELRFICKQAIESAPVYRNNPEVAKLLKRYKVKVKPFQPSQNWHKLWLFWRLVTEISAFEEYLRITNEKSKQKPIQTKGGSHGQIKG